MLTPRLCYPCLATRTKFRRAWLATLLAGALGWCSTEAASFLESGGRVVMEAEHFAAKQDRSTDSMHWHVVPDDNRSDFLNDAPADTQTPEYTGARGNAYIVSLPNAGRNLNTVEDVGAAPWVDYPVKISMAGEYQLYLRWAGYDTAADSIYAQIVEKKDGLGGDAADWYRYSRTPAAGFPWQGEGGREEVSGGIGAGEEPVLWNLTPGNYTIRISPREDGSAVDALILQLASLEPPQEPGPAESAVEGLLIARQPGSVLLAPGFSATLFVEVLGSEPVAYQWQQAEPESDLFADVPNATNATFITEVLQASDSGTKYRVQIAGAATNLTSREAVIEVDATPPLLVSALGGPDLNRVIVTFSERLDPVTAGIARNYQINGLTVTSAALSADGRIVTLGTTAQTNGRPYTLTANGVRDLVGNAIANGTIGFQGASRHSGGLRVDLYQAIPGGSVDLLTNSVKYPSNPDITTYWNVFGPFAAGNPYGDNYGGRASGWIVPPLNGEYRFFLRSDDASQLWLSTNDAAANLRLIAEQTGCCNAFTHAEGTLSSAPVILTAGRRYYVQALWKEGNAEDYLQVAWRTPADPDLNTVAGLKPISGEFLETMVDATSTLQIIQQPTNATVAVGSPVTFTVAFAAQSAFGTNATVQWQKASAGSATFTNIMGAVTASYTIPFVTAGDNNAKFRALVSIGSLTNKVSAEATLRVLSPEVAISRSGENIIITSTDGGTVQASATIAPAAWSDLGPAPRTISATNSTRFFRIRR
jgi:hypothetical protein